MRLRDFFNLFKTEKTNSIQTHRRYHKTLLEMDKSKVICLDIETTGLDIYNDEIVQLSIIDGNNNVLFNDYIKPERKTKWKDAEKIHGISPKMVRNKPTIRDVLPYINSVLENAECIVGYNSNGFDIPFLQANGVVFPNESTTEYVDVMKNFAVIYGEWSDYFCDWKWQKLEKCARFYGYKFNPHDSLEDVKATLFCHYKMCERYAKI